MITECEHVDSEVEQIKEVFARFGQAIFQAQGLERQLAILLATKYGPGPHGITRTLFDRILERHFLKTLGRLVKDIGTVARLSKEEEVRLQEALTKRNWLAHEYFWERAIDFLSESGRASMIEELQDAADLFEDLDKLFTNRTIEWGKEFGITRQALDKTLERLMKDVSG